MHHNTAGKRNEWEFTYKGVALLKAALAKKKYHGERLKWWMKKKEEVLSTIRKSGVEVNESIVDELRKSGYSTSNNVNVAGGTIRIRADLVAKLQECSTKVDAHTGLVRDYDGWTQAFGDSKDDDFDLQIGDWLFFFAK